MIRFDVEKCHEARRGAALIVDEEPAVRNSLRVSLESSFERVLGVATPAGALEAAARADFSVVLLDLWLGSSCTLALLPELTRRGAAVIVTSARPSYEAAVEAMRLGAVDYLPKPLSVERVRAAIRRLPATPDDERPSVEPGDAEIVMSSRSATFNAFLAAAERAAAADCVVLLRGESGTGKNVFARWLHEHSPRREGPFVVVHCPSLAGDLMASTLFGHRRGAFTGAVADVAGKVHEARGGTLFLDEAGDLGLDAQARLLRFLHDQTYERVGDAREERADVRIIAATNRDLEGLVRAGVFREDLLYRLDVITLTLPALRERREDIVPLAAHFLQTATARRKHRVVELAPESPAALVAHPWRGNLRELRHAVERAVVLAPTDTVGPRDLGITPLACAHAPTLGAEFTLDDIEREHIALVFARAPSVEAAARSLGIDATTLQRKRRRYGLA